jgi:hypothetical protein
MKKVLIFLVVGLVLFGGCSAQRANAQNANIAQKIIGSWVDNRGVTWVFNANGNLTRTRENGNPSEYKFGVTDTKLTFIESSMYGTPNGSLDDIYDVSISSDGKTLILAYPGNYSYNGYWLTKK